MQAMRKPPSAMHKRFKRTKLAPILGFDSGSLPAYPNLYVSKARRQCDVLLLLDAGVRVGT